MAKKSPGLKGTNWKLIYYIFYYIWKGMDGKKTLSGIVLTIGGVVLLLIPNEKAKEKGNEFLVSGLSLLIVGIAHKIQKWKKKKTKKKEAQNG